MKVLLRTSRVWDSLPERLRHDYMVLIQLKILRLGDNNHEGLLEARQSKRDFTGLYSDTPFDDMPTWLKTEITDAMR
jgi:hypothetical protein